jgi:predicted nucleic acid-binding protein
LARIIPLDAGVVGLLCCSPTDPDVPECKQWIAGLLSRRAVVIIPDVTDYEVRRELVRLDARGKKKLLRLDAIRSNLKPAEVTPKAWIKAAEFWAIVRRSGLTTAHPMALDADAILAAVAVTVRKPGDTVTIATTNVGHLARFPGIDAREWRLIT